MNAERRASNAEQRAIDAERILEQNRRDLAALWTSQDSSETRPEFPRSATGRWLMSSFRMRLSGPLLSALTTSLARMAIRRFFARAVR